MIILEVKPSAQRGSALRENKLMPGIELPCVACSLVSMETHCEASMKLFIFQLTYFDFVFVFCATAMGQSRLSHGWLGECDGDLG